MMKITRRQLRSLINKELLSELRHKGKSETQPESTPDNRPDWWPDGQEAGVTYEQDGKLYLIVMVDQDLAKRDAAAAKTWALDDAKAMIKDEGVSGYPAERDFWSEGPLRVPVAVRYQIIS